MLKIVKISTISINVTINEIKQLFMIYNHSIQNIKEYQKIEFDFIDCSFFSNHAVVFIGGLDLFLRKKYSITEVLYYNQTRQIKDYFTRLGFFKKESGWTHFPYSDFSLKDIENKKPYRDINTLLASELFPFKSNEVKDLIKDTIGELFLNVLQHSNSPAGATASAQYYPSEKMICFSVVDFGIGIARHIQEYFEQKYHQIVSSEEALLKAFERGFTTKENASGSGLKTIKDLVGLNSGKMSIFCNNIFYQYDGKTNSEIGFKFKGSFDFCGTLVIIEFNTQKIYNAKSE